MAQLRQPWAVLHDLLSGLRVNVTGAKQLQDVDHVLGADDYDEVTIINDD